MILGQNGEWRITFTDDKQKKLKLISERVKANGKFGLFMTNKMHNYVGYPDGLTIRASNKTNAYL